MSQIDTQKVGRHVRITVETFQAQEGGTVRTYLANRDLVNAGLVLPQTMRRKLE